jgi:plasmid maintenance system antidote protein VapI
MNLQTHYDLVVAEEALSSRLDREVIAYAEYHAA